MSERIFDRVVAIGSGLLGAALLAAATVHLRAPLPVPATPAAPAVPVAVAVAPAAAAVVRSAPATPARHAPQPERSTARPRAGRSAGKRPVSAPLTGSVTRRLAVVPAARAVPARRSMRIAAAPPKARVPKARVAIAAPNRVAIASLPRPPWYQPPAASKASAPPRKASAPPPRKAGRPAAKGANAVLPEPPVGYDPAPSLASTSVDTAAAAAVVEPAPNASAPPIFVNKRGR